MMMTYSSNDYSGPQLIFLSIVVPIKFMYEAGQTYTYAFKTSTTTYVQSTSDDQAVLVVEGNAKLTFRTPCDVSIELENTAIHGVDQSSKPLDSTNVSPHFNYLMA